MNWSQAFIPTLRDDPADAEAQSHRLLVRAGFIRQLMSGVYSLLPLGHRVCAKITKIVREEMEAIGGQEFRLPAIHPAEIWEKSGRWDAMGLEMFRFKDRRDADVGLGMTHEEVFATIATELRSYKQLPQIWYQIQTKFRDEPRPKSGLLRVREFTMKDSYSLDLTPEGLDYAFGRHLEAYRKIFKRCGLEVIAVEASSGAMGGSESVEFMVASDAGEDWVASCAACGYAANLEKAFAGDVPCTDEAGPETPEPFPTPGVRSIEDLANFDGGAPAQRQIKTLVYSLGEKLALVLLRGDDELVEQKLMDSTGVADLRPASAEEIRNALGAAAGSLGAVGVGPEHMILADARLQGRTNMLTGANLDGQHLRGVSLERDVRVDHWLDLRSVRDGEPCSMCDAPLALRKTVEVGHIFKLGTRYSEAMGAQVQAESGKSQPIIMGSYGIGIERSMAAVVETCHDEAGIVWPVSVAPYEVVVSVLNPKDVDTAEAGAQIYEALRGAGIDVILDDRNERPGVKFKDAELVGIPYRITVGPKGLAEKKVEVTRRRDGRTESHDLHRVAETVQEAILEERA